MAQKSTEWVITTLAIYQTHFWCDIAKKLQTYGQKVTFISFDDRSSEYLEKHSFSVYKTSQEDRHNAKSLMSDPYTFLTEFNIENIQPWLTHERFAFDLHDSNEMTLRLLTYLILAERCLKQIKKNGKRPVVIQELGGFISVIACFFAARKNQVDNWFIEPSFFRGRQFFLKNTFNSMSIPKITVSSTCSEVKTYLDEVLANKTIVIPGKDKHHYTAALKKIFNWHNIRRLFEKSIDKFVFGKHQEFGHLGSHVKRHAYMLINSLKLKGSYTKLSDLEHFLYYPLHVPGDMALTLRSPQFLDQLGLIDYLVRNLPHGYKLAVKEHPAMIGAVDTQHLKKLLKRYDQLALISPAENNFDVIGKCDGLISVNSKSGAEAVLLDKPVWVLGDAFYRDCTLTTPVEKITDIGRLLREKLINPNKANRTELDKFFQSVWYSTFPGELYLDDHENSVIFAQSLISALDYQD